MSVKDCLERMDKLNTLVPAWERHIQDYRDALGISAPPPDAEHVSHTRNVSVMSDKIAALVDAEKELDGMRAERDELKGAVMRWIGLLRDPLEVVYMTERYIKGSSNKEIAEGHDRTVRSVQMVLRSARIHIEQRVPDEP